MTASRSIWWSLGRSLKFRLKRLWTTFYFGQYSGKFTLLLFFPGFLSAVRYRAETRYGYHVFINSASTETEDASDASRSITPEPNLPYYLKSNERLRRWFAWKNGNKFYFGKDATVHDLKLAVYRGEDKIPDDVLIGCKGRMFCDKDNLAMATRTFCKRDPRIVIWNDALYNVATSTATF